MPDEEYDDTVSPFWKEINSFLKSIPKRMWDKLPVNFAERFEYYKCNNLERGTEE